MSKKNSKKPQNKSFKENYEFDYECDELKNKSNSTSKGKQVTEMTRKTKKDTDQSGSTSNRPKKRSIELSKARSKSKFQSLKQKAKKEKGLLFKFISDKSSKASNGSTKFSKIKKKKKNTYTSVKTRPTRLIFNQTSGASARADFAVDKSRYHFIWLIAVCLCSVLVVRAFYLQAVNAKVYQEKGNKFITSTRTVQTYRGMITDRNGLPLAVSAPLTTVSFSPYEYAKTYYEIQQKLAKNPQDLKLQKRLKKKLQDLDLNRLASVTNISVKRLKEVAHISPNVNLLDDEAIKAMYPKGAGSHYYPLMTKVPPEEAKRILDLNFVGIYKDDNYQRYYPQAFSNSQLLGFMSQSANDPDSGYIGRAGLERKHQSRLAGENGKVLVLRDARRVGLKEIKEVKPEKTGEDLQLTIDSRLQFFLYQELEKVGREQKAFWSSGMVVDVNSGEVLAMSTWPSYNANNLNEMTGENQRNRPVSDSFEPGSVIKPFTVAAALESGKFNKNSKINTSPGYIKVKGYTLRDHANLGIIGFSELLQHSSNVASTKIAFQLSPNFISDTQRSFGFGHKTALDLPGEQSGIVVTPKKKETARRATVSYGYGLQVTLAQIAQAYASLGAGGIMHPLTLLKDEKVEPKQIISRDHALSIVEMMESVTQRGGTAPDAAIDGYRVAGKTGTSRRVDPKGGYYKDKYRTIFAGLAPVSDPKLAVVILVENPQKLKYAGQVAAPVFHNVMKEALRLYNVPLDKPLKTDIINEDLK